MNPNERPRRGRNATRLPVDVLDRPRLRSELDAESALTVVNGPAGSGKTTLLAQWEQSLTGIALVHVAFGAEITNTHSFWREVLQQVADLELVEDAEGLAEDVRGFESLRDRTATLHRIFAVLRRSCVIIADNVERCEDVPFLGEIARVLEHAPRLRVVISTRRSFTPKHLQLVTGIDTRFVQHADLLFTHDEAREVIERISRQPAPPESIGDISALPISARIVGLSLLARQWPVGGPSTGRASVAAALMSTLITDEVPPDFKEFLLRTSLPSIVTAEIADRLGWGDSHEQHLERAEMYGLGIWEATGNSIGFTYTPVLREALITLLEKRSAAEVQALRRIVALWAFAHDNQLEALSNALGAKDYELASRFSRKSWFVLSQTSPEEVVELLKKQGPGVLNRYPVLATVMALMLTKLGRRVRAFGYFQSAIHSSRRNNDDDQTERLWSLSVKSLAERFASMFDRAEATAQQVYELFERMSDAKRAESESSLALLLSSCGMSLFYAGRINDAITVFEWGMSIQVPGDDGGWYQCASMLAGVKALQGKLNAARRVLREIDEADPPLHWRTDLFGLFEQLAQASVALAALDFGGAQKRLDSVAFHMGTTEHWPFFVFLQSNVYLLSGRRAEALRCIESALERGANSKTSPYALDAVNGMRVLALLSLGNQVAVERAFNMIGPTAPAPRVFIGFRALLFGQPQAAFTTLGSLAAGTDKVENQRLQALAYLTFALAAIRLGKTEVGNRSAEKAAAMLTEEANAAPLMMFNRSDLMEIRDAADGAYADFYTNFLDRIADIPEPFAALVPPVPLTARELAVIRELAKTSSTTAIASALFVSPNTVKVQRGSAYRKLGVSSREEALVRAAELGLLEGVR